MKRAFFLQGLRTTPPAPGEERVLYPGLVGGELRRQRLAEGIPYHPEVMNWFEEAAEAINHAGTETSFSRHAIILKIEHLPRQARDKHRDRLKTKTFLQASVRQWPRLGTFFAFNCLQFGNAFCKPKCNIESSYSTAAELSAGLREQ